MYLHVAMNSIKGHVAPYMRLYLWAIPAADDDDAMPPTGKCPNASASRNQFDIYIYIYMV